MQMDVNTLLDDIAKLMKYMVRNEKQSAMEVLTDLYTYTGFFKELTGIEINTNIFMNNKKIDECLAKYYYSGLRDFVSFLNANNPDLKTLSTNINTLVNPETIIHVYNGSYSILNKSSIFSEKEFKDILYAFFSDYGNNVYNIVKRMFDEKRIQYGSAEKIDYEAYSVSCSFTKDAYILTSIVENAINNMVLMAHELGHVIHFYTSIINNGESKVYMSPYSEVVSCSFEIAFMDYLMKNHIEPSSALLMLNDKFVTDLNSFNQYSEISDDDEFTVNIDGKIETSDIKKFVGKKIKDDLIYTLGYSIGLNMLMKYGNDKKEYMDRLNRLMYLMNKQSLKGNIETLGFDYDDFLSCKLIGPYVKEKNNELIQKLIK